MRDHEERHAPGRAVEQGARDACAQRTIEPDGRLVEHEQRRLERQRARERRELTQGRREVVGVVPGVRGEVEVLERAGGPSLHLPLPHTERARSEAHVVADGAGEELLVRVLEHRCDPPRQLLRDAAAGVPVADPHRSLVRPLEPGHEADHGRLAGAVAPQKRDALARGDGERKVLERRHRAVGEAHALETQGRNHCHRCTAWVTVRG